MSFLIYLISALIFLVAMVYGAEQLHDSQSWIAVATIALLSLSAFGSVAEMRAQATP